MTIKDFFKNIDETLALLESLYYKLRQQLPNDDFAPGDVYEAIYNLELQIANLEALKGMHRLYRIGDDEVDSVLEKYEDGSPVFKGKRIFHTVSFYETVYTIAELYNVRWEDVCSLNSIEPADLEPEMQLEIPGFAKNDLVIYENVATFDSHREDTVLGKDLDRNITFENNDLRVLEFEECLKQGVANILETKFGTHPFYRNLGVPESVGEDTPEEVRIFWKALRIRESLLMDGRAADVDVVTATVDDEGNDFLETEVISITHRG